MHLIAFFILLYKSFMVTIKLFYAFGSTIKEAYSLLLLPKILHLQQNNKTTTALRYNQTQNLRGYIKRFFCFY